MSLALALGACTEPIAIPNPPDLSALATVYERPTGTLSLEEATVLSATAAEPLAWVQQNDPSALVTTAIAAIASHLQQGGLPISDVEDWSSVARIEAVITADLACGALNGSRGATGSAAGRLQISTVIQNNRLSRVLWGTAQNCELAGQEPSTQLNGPIQIYRYEPIDHAPHQAQFLVRLEGTLGELPPLMSDFRIRQGHFEIRVPSPAGGDVIARLEDDALMLRARNETYRCDVRSASRAACEQSLGPR